MKRLLCLTLGLCLLLPGCGERLKEPVTFYYLRANYQYGSADGVIASEEREASGHRENLSYLLALYLMGPADEELSAPLPKSTRVLSAERSGHAVILELSDKELTDAEFTLACACLTLTCLEMVGGETVTVTIGAHTATMSRDSLTLYDSSAEAATEETQ